MKIAMKYKDGDALSEDYVAEDAQPSFDPIFVGNKDACVGVKIQMTGGVTVEVSIDDICDMIKAGFNT